MKTELLKTDQFKPAFVTKNGKTLAIRTSIYLEKKRVVGDIIVPKKLSPGTDYVIRANDKELKASKRGVKLFADTIGGFHVGLDGKITAASIWDTMFRPSCDPRGMVYVPGFCWVDIYLLNTDPQDGGTSRPHAQIADGKSPITVQPGKTEPLSWYVAKRVLQAHGKDLLSCEEFAVAMNGVEEDKTCESDPKITGHAPGLKSNYGIEQATGCMWTWGRDVHPDGNWLRLMGGCWFSDDAGPRQLDLGSPGDVWGFVGARGRCDHLMPGRSEAKA